MKFFDKNIDIVIFDMDGTIFDTERLAIKLYIEASQLLGTPLGLDILEKSIGLNAVATEKLMKETYGEDYPYGKVKEKFLQLKFAHIDQFGLPIKEGVKEVFRKLRENNVPMALATSTDRDLTEKYLGISGLNKYFQVIVCGNEVAKSKPEPEIFLKAVDLLGSEASKCIVLEDSENGLLAASRAGTIPVLIKDIKYPADKVRKLAFREYESMIDIINCFEF
ncbi:MAG: Fructose-1-phosphate phosphatase YqaB [Pelotomaculum sp. PtaB.Bin013]|uniref:HAD family phosphatase n=1 Tax=Pelotomaculum isophthalicicum JI TaxID=947010 RepID=A0A9X4H666_9FIRM|nr:HAD family phosphatase [Pelotomaculum isophthalicicum]MDF9408663.1 HAD family phosphatase [Pelotomaculum isophthalicicum JI]OPX80942.1 MAG: Fructose-1-phosphate phosphatase YqaB [Pelotomaculum sp. PtaB.Bin013]